MHNFGEMKNQLTCLATLILGLLTDLVCPMTTPLTPMQCLVGNCTSWAECRSLDLVTDCPQPEPGHSGDFLYSSCITEIVQKAHGKLTIEKKCGLSPCIKSDDWWSDECDRKADEDSYSCTSCCGHTLCNSAPVPLYSTLLLLLASLGLVYYSSAKVNK